MESGKSKTKVLADLVSDEDHFLAHRWHLFVASSGVEEARVSGASLLRTVIPFMRTPLARSNHFQKPHLLMLSPWGLGSQNMKFEEPSIQLITSVIITI